MRGYKVLLATSLRAEVLRECSVELIQTALEMLADRNVADCIPAEGVASAEIPGKIIIYRKIEQELFCLPRAQDGISREAVPKRDRRKLLGVGGGHLREPLLPCKEVNVESLVVFLRGSWSLGTRAEGAPARVAVG